LAIKSTMSIIHFSVRQVVKRSLQSAAASIVLYRPFVRTGLHQNYRLRLLYRIYRLHTPIARSIWFRDSFQHHRCVECNANPIFIRLVWFDIMINPAREHDHFIFLWVHRMSAGIKLIKTFNLIV